MSFLSSQGSLKVLHSPIGALYQPSLFVRGLRECGICADLMYSQGEFLKYAFDVSDTIILNGHSISSTPLMDFLLYAIETYDVFHFHSGYTLLPWDYYAGDLKLLKKLGKTVVMSRWGCRDGRIPSDFGEERGLCEICPVYEESCTDEIIGKRLCVEDKYADVIISHEFDFKGFNRSAIFLHGSVDLDFWRPDLDIPEGFRYPPKSENEIRILHTVGGSERGDVKGTSDINNAIDRLKRHGFKIDYRTHSGISFSDLRFHILQADIVIDQLRYGSFGSFSRESMALGKPVVGHVVKNQRDNLPGLPIVEAKVDNVQDVLLELLKKPEKLAEIGKCSREYAEKHFDFRNITKRLKNLYEEIHVEKTN